MPAQLHDNTIAQREQAADTTARRGCCSGFAAQTYTGLVDRVERRVIARLRETIDNSRQADVQLVVALTEELAWELFLRYDDTDVSMVDCASFAIMKQLGITPAFTFDRHSVRAGFQTLPKLR